jgi:predicted metal-dependent phosphoesterase TrpH
VTNHFFNAPIAVPEELPWEERVEMFCKGYEEMVKEGFRIGLDVFLGWEYSAVDGTHFLTYGLDKAWLFENPDVLEWDLLTYFDRVHESGGTIVHAHPFREGTEHIHLFPSKIDAVEVTNSCNTIESNQHAADFAKSYNIPETAGSDIHHITQRDFCGIVTTIKLFSAGDYIKVLRLGAAVLFEECRQ